MRLRAEGEISDVVLRELERELDLDERHGHVSSGSARRARHPQRGCASGSIPSVSLATTSWVSAEFAG